MNLETVCIVVFSFEYVMRLACCPNVVDFLTSFMNNVDLVAILPFYLGEQLHEVIVYRCTAH